MWTVGLQVGEMWQRKFLHRLLGALRLRRSCSAFGPWVVWRLELYGGVLVLDEFAESGAVPLHRGDSAHRLQLRRGGQLRVDQLRLGLHLHRCRDVGLQLSVKL